MRILCGITLVYLITFYFARSGNCADIKHIKLSLKELKTIYAANPSAFDIYGMGVVVYVPTASFNEARVCLLIKLSLVSYLWFKHKFNSDKKRKEKTKNEEYHDEMLRVIIEDCQCNIDRLKKQAKGSVEEAKDLINIATKDLTGTKFNFEVHEPNGYHTQMEALIHDDKSLDLFIVGCTATGVKKIADITLPSAEVMNLTTFLINNLKRSRDNANNW